MSKLDKKKVRLHDRILDLEDFLKSSLARKDSSTKEVDVGKITREIADLRKQLAA